ncbi:MAG: secondary thiamine-phosphate synthase enzyme YjbQ [Bdellovibrionales bacterium]|nr:secondary thiamine-phosphate synthase enzyme YjbQ [Bdellovibrionales bacterium]
MNRELVFQTRRQGLLEITDEVQSVISSERVLEGLCTVFVLHTSASLLIQENADPTAKQDLENWLNRLVPYDESFRHSAEGPDDMPSHIKAALTATSLGIPILGGVLALGTWQGVYLFEHRSSPHRRKVLVNLISTR